jgi:pseudouridine synthase
MLVRLHKFLADCGVASRRKSEELIKLGIVSVNNKPITRLGSLINPDTDEVRVKGQKITKESGKTYLMINKPAGYITTAKDTHNRKTVLDLIPNLKKRLFPVGRLDKDTTGLLFLTDDGELAFRITHPRFEVIKTYEVVVDGKFSERDFSLIKKGIIIEGKPHFFKEIRIVSEKGNCAHLLVKMIEGKKRQIRIMFEALGYRVLKLKRTAIGDVRLGSLREGEVRELTSQEVNSLKRITERERIEI